MIKFEKFYLQIPFFFTSLDIDLFNCNSKKYTHHGFDSKYSERFRTFLLSDCMSFSPPSVKTDTLLKHGHTDWLKKKKT